LGLISPKVYKCADGIRNEEVDLVNESAISFPEMPEWLGTQRNWISKPDSLKEGKRCLIWRMR